MFKIGSCRVCDADPGPIGLCRVCDRPDGDLADRALRWRMTASAQVALAKSPLTEEDDAALYRQTAPVWREAADLVFDGASRPEVVAHAENVMRSDPLTAVLGIWHRIVSEL